MGFLQTTKRGFKILVNWVRPRSAKILTGVGLLGFWGAGVWATTKAPKAAEDIASKETKKEKIKAVGKNYAGPLALAVASTGAILGGEKINENQIAAAAQLATSAQQALDNYQKHVEEAVGPKKADAIKNDIANDYVRNSPPPSNESLPAPGEGDYGTVFWMFETISKRWFRASVNQVQKVINDMNQERLENPYASSVCVNDFFDGVGLSCLASGSYMIWDETVQVNPRPRYVSREEADDSLHDPTPCIVWDFDECMPIMEDNRNRSCFF